jgi:ABC-type multidrug transport system ATPase subunit
LASSAASALACSAQTARANRRLIGLLSGTIEPDAGSLIVNGFDVPAERQRMYRSIGVCPQFDCLWDLLNGREHLALFGGVRGLTPAQIARTRG